MNLPKTQAEIEAELAAQIKDLGDDEQPVAFFSPGVPFKEELKKAVQIKDDARLVVGGVFEDVRMGLPVTLEPVKDSVKAMIDSMYRNPYSLLSLCMLKKRDEYTFMHSVNVGVLLIAFCRSIGMQDSLAIEVGIGGMLHDIGKTRISNNILDKPGPLTEEEMHNVQRHVELGVRLLQRTPDIQEASIQVVSLHHERTDGSGYPKGLKGDEIHLIGRMAAIIDVYDAITSNCIYRKSLEPHQVLRQIMGWSGKTLDETLCQRFVNCIGIYPIGSLVRLENGLIGVVTNANQESLLHPTVNIILDSKHKTIIEPREVDLLTYRDNNDNSYIIKNLESYTKWGIDPRKFMPMPELYF